MSSPVNSLRRSPGFTSLKELGQVDLKKNPNKTPSAGNSPEENAPILAAENRPPQQGTLEERADRLANRLIKDNSKFIKDINY